MNAAQKHTLTLTIQPAAAQKYTLSLTICCGEAQKYTVSPYALEQAKNTNTQHVFLSIPKIHTRPPPPFHELTQCFAIVRSLNTNILWLTEVLIIKEENPPILVL